MQRTLLATDKVTPLLAEYTALTSPNGCGTTQQYDRQSLLPGGHCVGNAGTILLTGWKLSKTKHKVILMLTGMRCMLRSHLTMIVALVAGCVTSAARAQESPWEGREAQLQKIEETFGDPPGMVRLDPSSRIWADKKNKRIVVDGYVALTSGQLEMLACIVGTKEHESVVALFSRAKFVHAGLLAIGAKKGTPVKWEPKYAPPTGSEVRVLALWKDKDGKKHQIDTRQWVRKVGTEKDVLDTNYVFAGSVMWKDRDTGKEKYMAESGDLICVSNFSTATLDVPMESSQVNSGLMFAAFTDRIPEQGTPIRLVLQMVDGKRSADLRANPLREQDGKPDAAVESADDAGKPVKGLEELVTPPNGKDG